MVDKLEVQQSWSYSLLEHGDQWEHNSNFAALGITFSIYYDKYQNDTTSNTDLYAPSLTQTISPYLGLIPCLQSLQYQTPSEVLGFWLSGRHSVWKVAGHDSQHTKLPPTRYTNKHVNNKSCTINQRNCILYKWTILKSDKNWDIIKLSAENKKHFQHRIFHGDTNKPNFSFVLWKYHSMATVPFHSDINNHTHLDYM